VSPRRPLFSVIFLVCLFSLAASAQEVAPGVYKSLPGPAQGVWPSERRPTPGDENSLRGPQRTTTARDEHESELSHSEMKQRKDRARTENKTGGAEIHLDGTPSPLAPNLGNNFQGLGQNGWIPYDAAIAAGPGHIVVMTNSQWVVYDRNGMVVRAVTDFGVWWPNGAGTPFDPKCFYDAASGKFVIAAVSKNSNSSFYHLSVSQTSDPTGAWWNYDLNARLDGSINTSNWADFPNVGYDDNAVYITSNQFTLATDAFQWAKVRVIKKSQAYFGQAIAWSDFVNMTNQSGSKSFTMQPSRTLTAATSEYLVNNSSGGSNFVTLWRIDNGGGTPTLTRQASLTVGSYTVPPDAPQPGTATLVATNDSRMYDTVWRNGILHSAFGESFSGNAASRYIRINTGTSALLKDITFTQPGVYYYFPAVTEDAAGNIYLVFTRSSSTEFASLYHTGMQPADSSFQASALVKAGAASNTSGRWGDYNAIANDPADNLNVILYAGWANTSNRWSTWVANATFAGGASPPTLASVSPNSGNQGTTVPVTLTGTNFISGATVAVSGSGVTAQNVVVQSGTSITADFVITAGAATGARDVTVTTGGGTTNPARTFTVNPASLAPTLATVSPNSGTLDSSVNVTLAGTNFISGATVNVSGTGVTVSNVNVASGISITATFNIAGTATAGPRNVTVTTANGTSGAQTFTVNNPPAPTLTSVFPDLGPFNGSVNVTLTGTNFITGNTSILLTLAGVTATNVNVVNSTQLTATFNTSGFSANTTSQVRVQTPGGTSNNQWFDIRPAPTLSSITPNSGAPGANVNVTLAGVVLRPPMTINIPAGGVTPANVVLVSPVQTTATFNIAPTAPLGPRPVTVTGPTGTSGPQTFTVSGGAPTLGSLTPNNGNPNSVQNVTLTGTNFALGSTVNVTGTGVSVGNINVVSNTTITADFTVASGATSGARNVSVTTLNGSSLTQPFTVNGVAGPPSVTTTSLAAWTQNFPGYNQPLAATGGTPPYTWTLDSGSLPGGLGLSSGGVISGTPTATGTFDFTVRVTDAASQSGTKLLSITINAPVSVTTASLAAWTANFAGYNQGVAATGGTGSLTWSITAGALPGGLNLNPASGALTGMPNAAGTFNFTATATDSVGASGSKPLSIVVNPPVSVSTTSLPGGQVNIAYAGATLAASGGTGSRTWSITSGALPGGITLAQSTGVLSGTPTASGTFNFTVTATDSIGASGGAALSITVNPAVSVATTSLPGGTVGTSYTGGTLTAAGGTLPYNWSITSGALPTNLNLNNSTGAITGTPTVAGTFNFTATVTDGLGQQASRPLSIVVSNPSVGPPTLTSIFPDAGPFSGSVNVTLTGTNFVTGNSTILFNAGGITVTNLNVVSSTTVTATFNTSFSANASRQVSVQTPNGTSGIVWFDIRPAPSITAVTPNSGARGTSVNVTIDGAAFRGNVSLAVSGGGITITNFTLVNNTRITATLVIDSGAATGARNVTVTSSTGTSAPATFTVN